MISGTEKLPWEVLIRYFTGQFLFCPDLQQSSVLT